MEKPSGKPKKAELPPPPPVPNPPPAAVAYPPPAVPAHINQVGFRNDLDDIQVDVQEVTDNSGIKSPKEDNVLLQILEKQYADEAAAAQ
jgi:hypothetical protein